MRKILLSLCGVLITLVAFGQDSIPNGNFERWDSNTYDYPPNIPYTSNPQNFYEYQLPFNVTKTTDAYHGSYALQLVTNASATDTSFGYILNANPNTSSNPSSWKGGIPYNQKPTGIRGYYKYNVATADSGTIMVIFKKAGAVIGMYAYSLGGIQNSYTLFNFTFSPVLPTSPDTVIMGALSCKFAGGNPHGIAGDTLLLDSISFTGGVSQPSMFDGDFESWQSQTLNFLSDWNTVYNGGSETGTYKTTDAVQGNYALELKTYMGTRNNQKAALAAQVSTGYYPNNCSGNCFEQGGHPFSNQVDTLAFYYKYAPSGNDTATINLNFKKNGTNIFGTGIKLTASGNYRYKEFPFNVGQVPDTVMIDIQSSAWNDTALTYVGSDLKIDHIYFKSSPITKTPVITWNNPADITYGTLLSSTQLNATANVPGAFVYAPVSGTKLNAGSSQSLRAEFTPTDTIDYANASKTVTINVLKAVPVINWSNPVDITYGTLLSSTQLNATADVPGAFVYTPVSGTKLNVGNGQSLKVDFTPTDTMDYVNTSKTVTINVLQAATDISSASSKGIEIYPNPVVDNLTIESPDNISSVAVTNIVGKIVYYKMPVSKSRITISTLKLSQGLYFVIVNTASGTATKLIMKSR